MAMSKREIARFAATGRRLFFCTRAWWCKRAARARPGGRLGYAAGELGRGLVAGLAGTAAITAASATQQLVEDVSQARKRGARTSLHIARAIAGPWLFAADVAGTILGVTPSDDDARRRLSIATHWLYGASWGASLGALDAVGVRGPLAAAALLAGVLGAEMLVLPALHLSPPPSRWGRKAVISSTYQHAIYAAAAGIAFRRLNR